MKIPGSVAKMALGSTEEPTGGIPVDLTPPPARAAVVADGIEYEVVWFGHRNAASLLPGDRNRPSLLKADGIVRIEPEDPNTKDRWSWLG